MIQVSDHDDELPAEPLRFRVEGNRLLVRDYVTLPSYCIRTGLPIDDSRLRTKTLYWGNPRGLLAQALRFAGLLFLIALLIPLLAQIFPDPMHVYIAIPLVLIINYAIEGLIRFPKNHERLTVTFGLSSDADSSLLLRRLSIIAMVVTLGPLLAMLVLFLNPDPMWGLSLWGILIGLPIAIGVFNLSGFPPFSLLRISRYRNGEFTLSGCKPAFLNRIKTDEDITV